LPQETTIFVGVTRFTDSERERNGNYKVEVGGLMLVDTVLAPSQAVHSFQELRLQATSGGRRRVAIVVAEDEIGLMAAQDALKLGIARPILIGVPKKIHEVARAIGFYLSGATILEALTPEAAARMATEMARNGEVDILLKGHLRTDQLLHAVLDKKAGLRTGRLLSDVMLYEDTLAGFRRLVAITDGGLNVAPSLAQKREIVLNAIEVMRAIGIERPKIAIMSATEAVNEGIASTMDAEALTEMGARGEFGEAEVFGPLALDNALLLSAAEAKGITSVVAGAADCMVVPNFESGNLLGKAVKYLGGSQCAHVVVGAKVPILIPSRVESADDKVNSMALGAMYAGR
jgi:phosphate butyryltransferase